METGKIKFYKEDKGFGFIIQDNKGPDIFFHISGVDASAKTPDGRLALNNGDAVQYTVGSSDKGPIAQNVMYL